MVKDRLVSHYAARPGFTEEALRHLVDRASSRFDGAHIRTYVPILVERDVRNELGR